MDMDDERYEGMGQELPATWEPTSAVELQLSGWMKKGPSQKQANRLQALLERILRGQGNKVDHARIGITTSDETNVDYGYWLWERPQDRPEHYIFLGTSYPEADKELRRQMASDARPVPIDHVARMEEVMRTGQAISDAINRGFARLRNDAASNDEATPDD